MKNLPTIITSELFIEPRKRKISLDEIISITNYMFKIPKIKLYKYFNKLVKNKKNEIVIVFGSVVNALAYTSNPEASDLDVLIIKKMKNNKIRRRNIEKFISEIEVNKRLYDEPKNNWNFFLLMYPHILIKDNFNYSHILNKTKKFFTNKENYKELLISLPLYIIRKNIYIMEDKPKEKILIKEFKQLENKEIEDMNIMEIKRKEKLKTILFADALGNKKIIEYLKFKRINKSYLLDSIERRMIERGFKKKYIKKTKKYLYSIYPSIY